jgi:hypothetical protein
MKSVDKVVRQEIGFHSKSQLKEEIEDSYKDC